MNAFKIEKELIEDGKLVLDNLPFQHGEIVEIIIHSLDRESSKRKAKSLNGSAYSYNNPFGSPTPESDWEVLHVQTI